MNISDIQTRANFFYAHKKQEIRMTINQSFSPWTFAKEVTKLAENGQAKSIESRKILDLSQFLNSSWIESCSQIQKCWRTVHVINDPELIKKGLNRAGRSSNAYHIYPTIIDQKLDSNNMLLCPTKEHKRLRNPFDKIFTQKYFEKHFSSEITNQVINDYAVADIQKTVLLKKEIKTIL